MKRDIGYLIEKYNSSYVKGEKHSTQTNKVNKQNQRKIEKHMLCEELIDEINLNFSPYQKEFIHYLIDRFDDFKKLHGRAKNEAIILVFMFFTKKIDDARINLNNYSISKKYGLDDNLFKLVLCRICDDYVKNSAMIFQESTKFNHEILSKNGGKL